MSVVVIYDVPQMTFQLVYYLNVVFRPTVTILEKYSVPTGASNRKQVNW